MLHESWTTSLIIFLIAVKSSPPITSLIGVHGQVVTIISKFIKNHTPFLALQIIDLFVLLRIHHDLYRKTAVSKYQNCKSIHPEFQQYRKIFRYQRTTP